MVQLTQKSARKVVISDRRQGWGGGAGGGGPKTGALGWFRQHPARIGAGRDPSGSAQVWRIQPGRAGSPRVRAARPDKDLIRWRAGIQPQRRRRRVRLNGALAGHGKHSGVWRASTVIHALNSIVRARYATLGAWSECASLPAFCPAGLYAAYTLPLGVLVNVDPMVVDRKRGVPRPRGVTLVLGLAVPGDRILFKFVLAGSDLRGEMGYHTKPAHR